MTCLKIAKCINNLRVFPRVFAVAFFWLSWVVMEWFMSLTTPTIEQAAVVSTLVGGLVFGFKYYVGSGDVKE